MQLIFIRESRLISNILTKTLFAYLSIRVCIGSLYLLLRYFWFYLNKDLCHPWWGFTPAFIVPFTKVSGKCIVWKRINGTPISTQHVNVCIVNAVNNPVLVTICCKFGHVVRYNLFGTLIIVCTIFKGIFVCIRVSVSFLW